MEKSTKTILIISSIVALGGLALIIFRKKGGSTPLNLSTPPSEQTTTPINTSLKGVDITRGGTYLPTRQEFQEWRKANPINLQLPTLREMLSSGKGFLNIGEQVPKNTTTSNYGIDQNKLAEWKKQYGL